MTKKRAAPPVNLDDMGNPDRNSDWIKHSPGYLESELAAHEAGMKIHKARLKAATASENKSMETDNSDVPFNDDQE